MREKIAIVGTIIATILLVGLCLIIIGEVFMKVLEIIFTIMILGNV